MGVEVQAELPHDLPRMQGDPSQLQQVFVNLLVNALQAMPEGGRLDLAARSEGDQLRVEVRDTGGGIDPGDLERVFLPFFSTKDVGEGTGLGLAVVHGIVVAHGGEVLVQSEPGEGACFELRLPIAPSADPARSA